MGFSIFRHREGIWVTLKVKHYFHSSHSALAGASSFCVRVAGRDVGKWSGSSPGLNIWDQVWSPSLWTHVQIMGCLPCFPRLGTWDACGQRWGQDGQAASQSGAPPGTKASGDTSQLLSGPDGWNLEGRDFVLQGTSADLDWQAAYRVVSGRSPFTSRDNFCLKKQTLTLSLESLLF